MSGNKIEHKRLYEQVIFNIEQQYQEGKLKTGDKLPSERDLAVLYGVSRGTLRDAFRVLESQGIIETKPGGGRYIRKSLKRENPQGKSIIEDLQTVAVMDLLEAREILEVGIMDLVCERITDEEITYLERLLNSSYTLEFDDKGIDYYFHQGLAEITENIVIKRYLKLNIELINQTRKKSFTKSEKYEEALKEHGDILSAIKERDPVLAKEKMKAHFIGIRKRLKGNQ